MPAKVYKKTVLALTRARAKLSFLMECQSNDVLPMSIHRIRLPKNCETILPKLRKICLRRAIRVARKNVYSILDRLIRLENQMFKRNRTELEDENRRAACFQEILLRNLQTRYRKKLDWILAKQSPHKKPSRAAPVICWDHITPPDFLLSIMQHGPMFASGLSKMRPENIMPDIEMLINGLSDTRKEYYRWKAAFTFCSVNWTRDDKWWRILRKTRKWLTDERIMVLKADKNKSLVLLKEATYRSLMQRYIDDTDCEPTDDGYIDKLQSRVSRFTRTSLAMKWGLSKAVVAAPDVPRLFAFAKTHKQTPSLRPVLDKARSPMRLLEKAVHNIAAERLRGYKFSTTNSAEFVEVLRRVKVGEDLHITVLDFVSLFPSIRLQPCFCALRDLLLRENDALRHREQILELAHLMCYTSVFQFNGATYLQRRGVPMGSPLSGDLCELVVRQLEEKVLPKFLPNISLYQRYVDDIFILWKTTPNLDDFLSCMNDNAYGLTLGLEQVSNSSAHFLDVNIRLRGGKIETSVYHKPDQLPLFIPACSSDPFVYKMAAFRALTKRAFTHPTHVRDAWLEIRRIEKIAVEHGYNKALVRGLARTYARRPPSRRDSPLPSPDDNRQPDGNAKRAVVRFNRHLDPLYREIASNSRTKIAYLRTGTLYDLLRNAKDAIDLTRAPGVYSIPIRDDRFNRDLVYIGSTIRSTQKRIREHQADIKHKRHTTALSTYVTDPEIRADFRNTKVIRHVFRADHIRHLEAWEIHKARRGGNCINYKDGETLAQAWKYLFEEFEQWRSEG
ncbi:uncharacterized protein LOC111635958 [Centruroides sculpturatus]|uniref:uncharacterized protein LOC111635958 n=1 Tax=Centruroides sculpturatus TaxID=218467 RepID=UPI000C6CAA2F|nr:uncharacterized protein LOC111635958 [Centruroides sculpturatus]